MIIQQTPPPAGGGLGTVILVLLGIVMLLPGLCALVFTLGFLINDPRGTLTEGGELWFLWLVCFAISAMGVWLIRVARRPTVRPPDEQ